MNSPQRHLRRVREAEEQAATDLKRLKTSFLQKVITKTIVREQCNPTTKLERSVRALAFNHLPGDCGNLPGKARGPRFYLTWVLFVPLCCARVRCIALVYPARHVHHT